MLKYPFPENLSGEQSEVLEKAAFLIISARKEATGMLARAGVDLPEDGFGTPCHAHIEGVPGDCPCSRYTGDGGTCLTRITVDPALPRP